MALKEPPKTKTAPPTQTPGARRSGKGLHALALGLALMAILAALVGAIGPAKHVRMRYSWPPRALPGAEPQKLWYTPLLLTRHEPQSLGITLPCALGPALPGAGRPTLVLGTTREAPGADGLVVVRRGERLLVRLGSQRLATVVLPAQQTSECAYRLQLGAGRWSIRGGPSAPTGGRLDQMPTVVGLFSGLDLRAGAAPAVELTTFVQGARAKTHQTVLWTLSALASLAALALVSLSGRPRRRRAIIAAALRRALARVGPPDVAVAVLLLVWWIVAPAFFDDGWVAARQLNYSASGGFSAYYTSFGVNLPLDYWLEWVEHWLVQNSTSLLVLRVPALVCLLGTWILCRWIFARTVGSAATGAARWTLACAFAVAALAWGMTFRPEPVLALMVIGVLACVVVFLKRERVAPLALAAVLVVLSLSAHPAGIVAFAPLLAAAPTIGRWVRANVRISGSIVLAATGLLVVLVTVGSDLQQRRADVTSLRTYGDETAGWRDELARYSFLSQPPYETPLRRGSVALIVLAVLAFVLRRRSKGEDRLLGLPATALGLALVLLIATPTKWPWHFGALIGLGAVAIAAETARLRVGATGRWDVRPFLVITAGIAAAAWAWNPRASWGDLDLRTLSWTPGFESRLTLSKLGGSLPLLLVILFALVEVAHRRKGRFHQVPWRAGAWMVAVIAVPLISFTVAVLIRDTVETSSWTLARQNLDSLRGRLRCGLGDDAVVAARGSMRPVPTIGSTTLPAPDSWLPPAPARGVQGFALATPSQRVPSRSPWFKVPAGPQFGFFLAGSPSQSESLELEWGRKNVGKVVRLGTDDVAGNAADDPRPDLAYWRFQAAGDLPSRPAGATLVRFVLSTKGIPGGPVGLTPPVTYENERLATLLERESPSLPLPNLLMYFPCVELPRVGVVAQTPKSVLALRDSMWPVATDTSPFAGLADLYPFVRLPLSDSLDPPGEVAVYEVERQIEGGVMAPPEQSPSA